jgi:hypothetical protein
MKLEVTDWIEMLKKLVNTHTPTSWVEGADLQRVLVVIGSVKDCTKRQMTRQS